MESQLGLGPDARRSIDLRKSNLILHMASVAPNADFEGPRPAFDGILRSFGVK